MLEKNAQQFNTRLKSHSHKHKAKTSTQTLKILERERERINLSSEILKHGGEVNRSAGPDTLSVTAFLQVPADPPDRKLQTGFDGPGNRLLLRAAAPSSRRTLLGLSTGLHFSSGFRPENDFLGKQTTESRAFLFLSEWRRGLSAWRSDKYWHIWLGYGGESCVVVALGLEYHRRLRVKSTSILVLWDWPIRNWHATWIKINKIHLEPCGLAHVPLHPPTFDYQHIITMWLLDQSAPSTSRTRTCKWS